jgi:2-hydroxy-3-oxopropionate reductase
LNPSIPNTRIAFLGIGLMGNPMALRLLNAGFPLWAWNRSRDKAQVLAEYDALIADTPAQAVADADIVITMLEAGPVVADVVQQALPSLCPGSLLIDMSSTRQAEAQALHALLEQHQVHCLDAPVSGGVLGAELGDLAIMAGGSEDDFKRAQIVFDVLGHATLVGPAGCGQLAKLCNQLIVGGTLNIVAEALLLAQAGGADPAAVRSAIRGGFAESRILEVHGQRMLERNFLPGGQVKSQAKDMDNILAAAKAAGLTLPLTELVTGRYHTLLETIPHADHSAALIGLEQQNPGKRVGTAPDTLPD